MSYQVMCKCCGDHKSFKNIKLIPLKPLEVELTIVCVDCLEDEGNTQVEQFKIIKERN